QTREPHESGLPRRFAFLQELVQRKADPRNPHRPGFDASVAVDAILERLSSKDVFEVIHRWLVTLPVDRDRPRLGPERPGKPRRLFRIGPELVEVVIRGDLIPGVRPLAGAERAGLHALPLATVRRRLRRVQPDIARDHRRGDARSNLARGPEELPATQVRLFAGDFRARDLCRAFDDHSTLRMFSA